jgi:sugar lactone lactonase YvrE
MTFSYFKTFKIFLFILLININASFAQKVETIIGNQTAKTGIDALSIRLGKLQSMTVDFDGNIYYAEDFSVMKKNALTGLVTRVAGTGIKYLDEVLHDGICATCFPLYGDIFIDLDRKRNFLYISDNNRSIKKVDLNTNLMYAIAGNGIQYGQSNGDGGLAINAQVAGSQKIVTDSLGNIYFSQRFIDNRVRKIDIKTGIISTVLGGNSNTTSPDGSLGTMVSLGGNFNYTVDFNGNIYFSDYVSSRPTLWKVDAVSGKIVTLSGMGTNMMNSCKDGEFINNCLVGAGTIYDLHVDNHNNLFVIQADKTIAKINLLDGKFNIIAGVSRDVNNRSEIASGDGAKATLAVFTDPSYVVSDSSRNIYVIDKGDYSIRIINAFTNVITRTNGAPSFSGDGGVATSANINSPSALAYDKSKNIYFSDNGNHRIRKYNSSNGIITSIAGNGNIYKYVTSSQLISDYNGRNATEVSLSTVNGIAVDSLDNMYFTQTDVLSLNLVFKLNLKTGILNIIAGSNPVTEPNIGDGGDAKFAKFLKIGGIAVDNNNDIYVSDEHSSLIKKIDAKTNIITTIAGVYLGRGKGGYRGDGELAIKAILNQPKGISFDTKNNLYINDSYNQVIRRISSYNNAISTVGGMAKQYGFSGDGGQATEATMLNSNGGIAVDSKNSLLYFSDNDNNRIRRIDLNTGIISTVIGNGFAGYNGNTFAPISTNVNLTIFNSNLGLYATGILIDTSGNVLFTDINNNSIRKITDPKKIIAPAATPSTPNVITVYDKFVSVQMSTKDYNDWVENDFWANNDAARIKLIKEVYSRFKDEYDFVVDLLSEPLPQNTRISYSGANLHVSNSVKGIGSDIEDNSAVYGSFNGRLKSTIQLVTGSFYASPLVHEIGHQFANFILESVGYYGPTSQQSMRAHWGFTGGSTPGILGGFQQNSLREKVDGIANKYSVKPFSAFGNSQQYYNDFEMYLMGFMPIDSVQNFDLFNNIQDLVATDSMYKFTAQDRISYTPAKIIAKYGNRIPTYKEAQKDFKALFLVLSPRSLTPTEINKYNEEIIQISSKGPGTFYSATKGLGTLNADIPNLQTIQVSGTIEQIDSTCGSNRFKAYPLANGGYSNQYEWYLNNVKIDDEKNDIILIKSLQKNDHISCKISNSVGLILYDYKISSSLSLSAPIVSDTSVCQYAQIDSLNIKPIAGNSLIWYGISATGGTGSSSATKPSTSSIGTTSYYVSQYSSSLGCESPRSKISLTVRPIPSTPSITRDLSNNLVSSATSGNQWYADTTAGISGQNAQNYKPSLGGYYAVKVTQNNCNSLFSDKYYFLVTALTNFTNDQFIHLYPNPTSNDLIIDYNLTGQTQVSVKIFDVNGNVLITKNKISKGGSLSVRHLITGTYFVQVMDKKNQLLFTDKFIKQQ